MSAGTCDGVGRGGISSDGSSPVLRGVRNGREVRAVIVGGRQDRLGEALVGALSHNRSVTSAELVEEAAEAAIWSWFGSADLVVVFPDAAPFPKKLVSELESHGCALVGAFEAGDVEGEAILAKNAVRTRVPLGADLDSAVFQILRVASGSAETGQSCARSRGSQAFERHESVVPSAVRRPRSIGVASLGHSAGGTTLTIALARVLAQAGWSVAVGDVDCQTWGLSRWLGVAKRKDPSVDGACNRDHLGDSGEICWRIQPLSSRELLACAKNRPDIAEESGDPVSGRVSPFLPLRPVVLELQRRAEAVILDAGSITRGVRRSLGMALLGSIGGSMGADPLAQRGWILVCRADPGGVKTFIETWGRVCGALGDSTNLVVALNLLPEKVPLRKLRAHCKALVSATGCSAVVCLPHDPRLLNLFWSTRLPSSDLGGTEFTAAVRSLAESAGFEIPAFDGANGNGSGGRSKLFCGSFVAAVIARRKRDA